MEELHIKRLVLKKEGFEIEIEREGQEIQTPLPSPSYVHPSPPLEKQHTSAERSSLLEEVQPATFVTSPMVGTFYSAPSPEDPHFVKVGDVITEQTIVGIIEAMKVMNEVKAAVSGTVLEILVRNGDPVEFGTRILRIEPHEK